MSFATVLRAAEARGPVKRIGHEYKTNCPAPGHDDENASWDFHEGEGGTVVSKCRSRNCPLSAIAEGLGLEVRDFFAEKPTTSATKSKIVATYSYRDAEGTERYQVTRWDPKSFRPRRIGPDGKWIWNLQGVERIPYLLPELMAAPMDTTVFIVEGEKDADALAALGMGATTNPGGCGSTKLWDTEPFRVPFKGRDVAIIPDADAPGEKHAQSVARALAGVARSVKVVRL